VIETVDPECSAIDAVSRGEGAIRMPLFPKMNAGWKGADAADCFITEADELESNTGGDR